MDKYGVDEQHPPPAEKQAGVCRHCPYCGKELALHGRVWLCPTHGSSPFEELQDGK